MDLVYIWQKVLTERLIFLKKKSKEELNERFDELYRNLSFASFNEILDSVNLKVIKAKENINITFTKTPCRNKFEKHVKSGSDEDIKHAYKKESERRKIKSSKRTY